jgi:4-nitrophenyl phosphatase
MKNILNSGIKMIKNSKINLIDEINQITNNYEYFIFDCDGVIWKENKIFESTVKYISELQNNNKSLFFLSNTNKSSRLDLKNKFEKLCGLKVEISQIYTSSFLISKHIHENYENVKNIYLIGSKGLQNELENKGFTIYGGPSNKNIDYIENFSASMMDHVHVDENIHACVCGYDEQFNLFKIFYASQIINKTGMFFGTNYDNKTLVGKKYFPGSYTFIAALEATTEIKADIVTKPDPRSLEIILTDHNIPETQKNKILMIGDNLNTDIKFANNNGIDSLLVLTGVTSEEEFENLKNKDVENKKLPTYVMKNF